MRESDGEGLSHFDLRCRVPALYLLEEVNRALGSAASNHLPPVPDGRGERTGLRFSRDDLHGCDALCRRARKYLRRCGGAPKNAPAPAVRIVPLSLFLPSGILLGCDQSLRTGGRESLSLVRAGS